MQNSLAAAVLKILFLNTTMISVSILVYNFPCHHAYKLSGNVKVYIAYILL